MRRRAGYAGIERINEAKQKYEQKKAEIKRDDLEQFRSDMEKFKQNLSRFALKHRDEIRKNAVFRRQFQDMCASIGVDPLASSKGFWSQMLGVGDYFYELAVTIIEVCISSSSADGPLISLHQLHSRVCQQRPLCAPSTDDIVRAVARIATIDSTFRTLTLPDGRVMVQCASSDLGGDAGAVLRACRDGVYRTGALGWCAHREQMALQQLLRDELAWIDQPTSAHLAVYYFPSLLPARQSR